MQLCLICIQLTKHQISSEYLSFILELFWLCQRRAIPAKKEPLGNERKKLQHLKPHFGDGPSICCCFCSSGRFSFLENIEMNKMWLRQLIALVPDKPSWDLIWKKTYWPCFHASIISWIIISSEILTRVFFIWDQRFHFMVWSPLMELCWSLQIYQKTAQDK